MFFWDYGNAFLLEAQRAGQSVAEGASLSRGDQVKPLKRLVAVSSGAPVEKVGGGATEFRYPSYVQHIMG